MSPKVFRPGDVGSRGRPQGTAHPVRITIRGVPAGKGEVAHCLPKVAACILREVTQQGELSLKFQAAPGIGNDLIFTARVQNQPVQLRISKTYCPAVQSGQRVPFTIRLEEGQLIFSSDLIGDSTQISPLVSASAESSKTRLEFNTTHPIATARYTSRDAASQALRALMDQHTVSVLLVAENGYHNDNHEFIRVVAASIRIGRQANPYLVKIEIRFNPGEGVQAGYPFIIEILPFDDSQRDVQAKFARPSVRADRTKAFETALDTHAYL